MCRYVEITIPQGLGEEALRLGQLVHEHSLRPGAHRTPAAETGNDVLSHTKGKYGELAFNCWLTAQGLTSTHTPFRDDYTIKNPDDDFIVNGVRLEVKAKRRPASQFPPPVKYNVNIGKREIENAIHVFVEICGNGALENDPASTIVGWATPTRIVEIGKEITPGDMSENGKFKFQRFDWDIEIGDLFSANTLADAIRRGTIPANELG